MTARTEHWAVWLTLLLCVLAACVAVFCAFNLQGISDTDVDQAVADDKSQALADAAQVAFGKHPLAHLEK